MLWSMHPNQDPEALGFIPSFLSTDDPRSSVEQIHESYLHGGGWREFKGFQLDKNNSILPMNWRLKYPQDPEYKPIGYTRLRGETVVVWQYSWVTVHNDTDETFRCARID